ncbi:uncharacterized protein LOC133897830 [Phragmites australis]|uniref:uncharacterized protein LOC133897830 n=1 Tax=Phragmites australis TaxID=29695 RepID=UPI002D79B672|nr:uncharacterized protein LOC133897830 [Phragmites australis]
MLTKTTSFPPKLASNSQLKTHEMAPKSSPDQKPTKATPPSPAALKKLITAMDIKKRWTSPLPSLNAPPSMVLLLLLVSMAADGTGRHRAAAQVFCRSQFNLANEACSLRTFSGPNPAQPLQLRNASAVSYELQADHHDHAHEHEHEREHTHSRRHGLGHGGHDPYDTACCRRLMGIDNACICQAMSFLPVFMSRVKHAIKLTPVPGCDVSFECAAVY